MNFHLRRFGPAFLSTIAATVPAAALAQTPAHAPPHDKSANDDSEIVVTGHPPIDFGILAATTSLAGDKLVAETRGQIGETLVTLPGVSATSFAPGASRPVLRGFTGARVAVLVDGIGTIDASTVSVDHAVVFDPLTVDHIDIYHGPSVLIFGGNAIGGAVNALDKRIPRAVPDAITGTALGGYGSAADERSGGGALEIPLGGRFAAHVDANWRKSDDVRVGGKVISAPLRSQLLSDAAELRAAGNTDEAAALDDAANLSRRVPNTAARSTTLGAGLAFIDAGGDLGVSVQQFDTRYGVPIRPGSGEDEPVAIDLAQTRVDMRGSIKFGGALESLQFRGTYGTYRHAELEGDVAGTRFAGEGIEFRADLVQAKRGGWRGRSGVQFSDRSLTIAGEEAFTPDYAVEALGFYTLQSIETDSGVTADGAVRFDRATVKADRIGFSRAFDLWSAAAGLSWQPAPAWTLGVNYVHGARAPSPEELLSDGVHVATQSYELGSRDFTKETSDGGEVYVRYTAGRSSFALTGFVTDFGRFIASLPTGDIREEFPVFAYRQVPARFYGFEFSGQVEALAWDGGALTLNAVADYTHARLKNIGPAPLTPPLRLRGGVEAHLGNLRAKADIEWNARQSRVAANAYPVDGFTLVNLGLDWHPLGEGGPLTLTLAADNLFDVVGRRAASVTRDFVPLPGRDIRVTGKVDF